MSAPRGLPLVSVFISMESRVRQKGGGKHVKDHENEIGLVG